MFQKSADLLLILLILFSFQNKINSGVRGGGMNNNTTLTSRDTDATTKTTVATAQTVPHSPLTFANGSSSTLLSQLPPSVLNALNILSLNQNALQPLLSGNPSLSSMYPMLLQSLPKLEQLLENGLKSGNVTGTCQQDISTLLKSAVSGKTWALAMLDASGKPPQGIMKGNLNFIGQYDECRETVTFIQSNSSSNHVVRGTTCVVTMKWPKSWMPAQWPPTSLNLMFWHLCVPDTCNKYDITDMTSKVLSQVNLTVVGTNCRDEEQPDFSEDAGAIVSLCIICVLLTLVLLGTLLDIKVRYFASQQNSYDIYNVSHNDTEVITSFKTGDLQNESNVSVVSKEGQTDGLSHDTQTKLSDFKNDDDCKEPQDAMWKRVLLCFSVPTNSSKLLSMKRSRGSIGCLHGIRVMSMTWIILGHTFLIMFINTSANPAVLFDYIKSFSFQMILNAGVSVDTFFLLSGFLTGYLFLRETAGAGRVTCRQMALYYFHRYWRLTPTFLLWLMIYVTLLRYIGDGPQWNGPVDLASCVDRGRWIYDVLYLTNLSPQEDQCFGISWYVSNDMQFHVVAPLALVPLVYKKFRVMGFVVLASFLLCHVTNAAVLVSIYNAGILVNGTAYTRYIYFKPYARIGPYAIGIALGYLLHQLKCTADISRTKLFIGWFLSVATGLTIMFVTYDENGKGNSWTGGERALFEVFMRIGWSCALSWVIFVCATGNGSLVNSILNWEGWLPLSKLTYGAYFIHIIIMTYITGTQRLLGYISVSNAMLKFCGYSVMSYIFAYISSLVIETPLLNMEKIFLRRHK